MQTSRPRTSSTKETILVAENDEESTMTYQRSSSAKISAMAERRAARGLEMQQQLQKAQGDIKKLKGQLASSEEQKSRLLGQLEEMKKMAEDATKKLDAALLAQKLAEDNLEKEKIHVNEMELASIGSAQKREQAWQLEFEALQRQHVLDAKALSSVEQELVMVCEELQATIRVRDEARKEAEVSRNQVNDLLMELDLVKEALTSALSRPNCDLKNEDDSSSVHSSSMAELLKQQIEKEKDLKTELIEKDALVGSLQLELSDVKDARLKVANALSESRTRIEMLELELEEAKESELKTFELLVSQTKQWEESKISFEEAKCEIASLNEYVKSLEATVVHCSEEVISHRNLVNPELQEALAAREVVTEANEAREKLALTQVELKDAKMEIENLKMVMRRTEEHFQQLLDEARRELDSAKLDAERWRLEYEESNAAWNGKEAGFVQCMKRSEEEMDDAKEEKAELMESLMKANEIAKIAKDENARLRDILKEALNEASVAKESAEIARAENHQLKENLSELGSELERITHENKQLQINEAEALKKIKELDKLLYVASNKELGGPKKPKALDEMPTDYKKTSKLIAEQSKEQKRYRNVGDGENAYLLTGTTFSMVEGHDDTSSSLSTVNHRKAFSVLIDETDNIGLDDFDGSHVDTTNGFERNLETKQQKKKTLIKKFGRLLRKRTSVIC